MKPFVVALIVVVFAVTELFDTYHAYVAEVNATPDIKTDAAVATNCIFISYIHTLTSPLCFYIPKVKITFYSLVCTTHNRGA